MWYSGFCSKLRAPHRGTSLGSFVWGPSFLAVFINSEPHLAPGVRRCSAIALRLEGMFVFFWATTLKLCRQQRDFAAGISAPMFFGVE